MENKVLRRCIMTSQGNVINGTARTQTQVWMTPEFRPENTWLDEQTIIRSVQRELDLQSSGPFICLEGWRAREGSLEKVVCELNLKGQAVLNQPRDGENILGGEGSTAEAQEWKEHGTPGRQMC